ncbi:MAG: cysteine desulfurase-like protein [Fuerstiella sp.]
MPQPLDVARVRAEFPGLQRVQNGETVAFLDGPAGSQVPESVAQAVSNYLLHTNANRGASHATSRESDATIEDAHRVLAEFLNADSPDEIVFGANMTSITFAVSRALAKTWQPGDEILLSRLDHDANVTPWVLAAQDAGATVRHIDLRPEDATLDQEDFKRKLSERTKLVAVGYASNATGTINPLPEMLEAARQVGAVTYIDAVHYAPHGLIDVVKLQCDFLVCSAYKFFGPHVGVLFGRGDRLRQVQPYKLRPAPNSIPGRWMTGTQNHEGIAGAAAAVHYLAGLGGQMVAAAEDSLRDRLSTSYGLLAQHEQSLALQFLSGLQTLDGVRLHGISDLSRLSCRVPTFSLTFDRLNPAAVAEEMAKQGIFCWAGNHYALPFTEATDLEPHGTLRIGALHYNTADEVDRTLHCLERLLHQSP